MDFKLQLLYPELPAQFMANKADHGMRVSSTHDFCFL